MATRVRPTRPDSPSSRPSASVVRPTASFVEAFPSSRKVFVEGSGNIKVPMREIVLSGGELPVRVYDTSGPQGIEVRNGLPALRSAWVLGRA